MFNKPLTLGTYLVTVVVITDISMAISVASSRSKA